MMIFSTKTTTCLVIPFFILVSLSSIVVDVVDSFDVPHPFTQTIRSAFIVHQRHFVSSATQNSLFTSTDNVIALPQQTHNEVLQQAMTSSSPSSTSSSSFTMISTALDNIGDVGNVLRTVAIGVTALVFLIAGLTYLTASVLIPAGAEQLEIECQQFIPTTWKDYLAKLEDGQQMKDRPDLMFELGLLLNKAKADQLQRICEVSGYTDLLNKYESLLQKEQKLQDRPDLIQQLYQEIGQRETSRVKEECPPDLWQKYESQLVGNQKMSDRPDLMKLLLEELNATTTNNNNSEDGSQQKPKTFLLSTQPSQWDDDDNDK